MNSPYYTDPIVRERIDTILQKCATLFSNLGTSTNFDVQNTITAKQTENEWLKEIQQLDPEFYQKVRPQGN
jgi:hypothetical protein